ncbi:MAG: hypothetical protein KJO08_00440 [Gammaproteobacteria bacterium]|nr:hypothetical protein [Gammaproteobacteria bacterium]NNJ85151.1 hypothetical protein [Gammaproteobacteria bacterium]
MSQEIVSAKENAVFAATFYQARHSPYDTGDWREVRAAKIKALRGQYRDALTPSEEFARKKAEEISHE